MMVILWLKFTTNVDNLMSRIAVETMAVELRVPAGRLWNRKNSWNLEVKTWKNFQFEKNKFGSKPQKLFGTNMASRKKKANL